MRIQPFMRPGKTFDLSVNASGGSASDNSATPFDTGIEFVRIVATAPCRVAFDTAAGAASMYLESGYPEYFRARGSKYISVIGDTATTGTLNVTALSA